MEKNIINQSGIYFYNKLYPDLYEARKDGPEEIWPNGLEIYVIGNRAFFINPYGTFSELKYGYTKESLKQLCRCWHPLRV